MRRPNPLLTETLRGLGRGGQPQQIYLGYLAIQAMALWLWWPRQDIAAVLVHEKGPDTLLAVIVAIGAALAYYGLRAGAEEFALPGQQSLREWAGATSLALGRILYGYLGGHVVQTLHLLLLSSPLALMAFTVSGGEWSTLTWSALAILVQATFYRLTGAVVYMAFGHLDAMVFVALRAIVLTLYIGALALMPVASHVAVTFEMLEAPADMQLLGTPVPPHVGFIVIYTGASIVLAALLYRQLLLQRRIAA